MEQNNQQPQQNGTPTTNNNTQNPQSNQNPNPAPTPTPAPQQPKPAPAPVQPKPVTPPPAPKVVSSATAQSKKNLIVSGIIILVVLVLLLLVPRLKRSAPDPAPADTGTELQDDQNDTEVTAKPNTTSPSAAPSRAEALASYAGKMITISGACDITPEDQTQPLGTTILINNDTDTRHTVTIGPKSYTVSGKHYTLSWLNMAPGTFDITCDGADTEATIDVE
jgi:hypothetical protein